MINMDFITFLPSSRRQHDSIWLILDRLTMPTHFLSVNTTYQAKDYAKMYIQEVVRLYGIMVSIIPYRGAQINAHIQIYFEKGLG